MFKGEEEKNKVFFFFFGCAVSLLLHMALVLLRHVGL